MTLAFPCTKLELPTSLTTFPLPLFSVEALAVMASRLVWFLLHKDYFKYNQNRCTVLNQIVLWTLKYRHTFLDQKLDLKWDKEIFIKSLDSYLDHWFKGE